MILAYDANKDGWDPKSFHKKLDKKGPAVVLCKSTSGSVFGGYNPTGWVNEGELRGSIAAFLFCFPGAGDPLKLQPIKLAKISGAGLAQVSDTPYNTPSYTPSLTSYHSSSIIIHPPLFHPCFCYHRWTMVKDQSLVVKG